LRGGDAVIQFLVTRLERRKLSLWSISHSRVIVAGRRSDKSRDVTDLLARVREPARVDVMEGVRASACGR